MGALQYTRAEARLLADGYTPAQIIMRREMEARTQFHASHLPKVINAQPGDTVSLSVALDEVMGPQSVDKEVALEAWAIINEHGEGLVLNWQQWPIVQKLVEQAIISGRAGS